jgi:outer membrane protein assembly factor BamB
MNRKSALALALGLFGVSLFAADWPQWQGPTRDNLSKEKGLLPEWPKDGPKLLWTCKTLGHGYSGPAVVGDRIYILGTQGGSEYLFALDNKGTQLWQVKLGPTYTFKGNQWGVGPRSTASVAGDLVYALGGSGDLVCATTNGKEKWRKSMPNDLGGEVNPIGGGPKPPKGFAWGWCWSPLVDGDQLICYPGGPKGALAALDRQTGNLLWRSKDVKVQCSYSSPIVGEVGGVRQYIFVSNEGLHGVDAKDGKSLWNWKKTFPKYGDYVVPTPVLHGDSVYISVGPVPGCDLVKLTEQNGKFTAKKVYGSKIMKNALGGVVLLDGHVYGHSYNRGWLCQDIKTGKEVWADKTLDGGSLVSADGRLYCYTEEDGIVALVEATPQGWKEKGRFTIPQQGNKAVSGKHWTRPVVANGRLYLRDQELLFCYDVKGK